jgi:hypothetical protein
LGGVRLYAVANPGRHVAGFDREEVLAMIFTRRFGALRARPVFPSVVEREDWLDYFGDVSSTDSTPEPARSDESAA